MVDTGQVAVVHYTVRLASGPDAGEVVDTSDVDVALAEDAYYGNRDYAPLAFEVGSGEVLAAVDDAVREMDPGDERTLSLDPGEAFGPPSPGRVVEVPREDLEARSGVEAAEGELVVSDRDQAGWITDVSDDDVTVDFNHELAAEPLDVEVRVVEVR